MVASRMSATLIGQLAVAKHRQVQRPGAVRLTDAPGRAFDSAGTVGSSMLSSLLRARQPAGFSAAHGFVRLPDAGEADAAML